MSSDGPVVLRRLQAPLPLILKSGTVVPADVDIMGLVLKMSRTVLPRHSSLSVPLSGSVLLPSTV